jgi:hypothetical protein
MPLWFWIVISAAVAAAVGVHIYAYRCYHYVCPKCAKHFKPKSFLHSMFALNAGEYRKVRCSFCHTKDWAKAEKISCQK